MLPKQHRAKGCFNLPSGRKCAFLDQRLYRQALVSTVVLFWTLPWIPETRDTEDAFLKYPLAYFLASGILRKFLIIFLGISVRFIFLLKIVKVLF